MFTFTPLHKYLVLAPRLSASFFHSICFLGRNDGVMKKQLSRLDITWYRFPGNAKGRKRSCFLHDALRLCSVSSFLTSSKSPRQGKQITGDTAPRAIVTAMKKGPTLNFKLGTFITTPHYQLQGWAKEWSLGCMIPASWLPLAAGRQFTQPRNHSVARPCR